MSNTRPDHYEEFLSGLIEIGRKEQGIGFVSYEPKPAGDTAKPGVVTTGWLDNE